MIICRIFHSTIWMCDIFYLVVSINRRPYRSELQKGSPNLIPGLTAKPFWNTEGFPWIRDLEAKFADIKAEFLKLRDQEHMFQVIISNIAQYFLGRNCGCFSLIGHRRQREAANQVTLQQSEAVGTYAICACTSLTSARPRRHALLQQQLSSECIFRIVYFN
jgi:hypothetical protein